MIYKFIFVTLDSGVGIFLLLSIFSYLWRSENYVCGHFYLLATAFVLPFLGTFFSTMAFVSFPQDSVQTLGKSFPKGSNATSFTTLGKSPYKVSQSSYVAVCGFLQ